MLQKVGVKLNVVHGAGRGKEGASRAEVEDRDGPLP